MSTEPKRVDVLSVIREMENYIDETTEIFDPAATSLLLRSNMAYSAVAELIEASKALNAAMSEEVADDKGILRAWIDHKEALSRIGGTP